MEVLEAAEIFDRWYREFFKCSIDDIIISWDCYDVRIFPCNCIYYSPKDDFWGSRKWMAVFGMHYYFCRWDSVVLHGNYGAIFVKNLYGSKKETTLCNLLHQ